MDTTGLTQPGECVHWSWPKFWIGKLSNKFIAWVTYMVLQFLALLSGQIPDEHIGTLLWVSAIVTFIFMLAGAIDVAVTNAQIKLSGEAKWTNEQVKQAIKKVVGPPQEGGQDEL